MRIQDALVRKSNILIETPHQLSIIEQKLILLLASRIKREDRVFKPYKIKISDFIKLTGNRHHDYAAIEKIIIELKSKNLRILLKDEEETTIINTSWLMSSKYIEGSNMIELCFAPTLKPLLLDLKTCFTSFQLKNILYLKSNSTIPIYELLKQYEKIGFRTLSLKDLKTHIGIQENEYKLYGHFKSRILLKAQKELKEKTDICFDFQELKEGRKVVQIKFIIRKNIDIVKLIDIAPIRDINENSANVELGKLVKLLPKQYQTHSSIEMLLKKYLLSKGFDYVTRNIEYTNNKSNAIKSLGTKSKKNNYRGYLKKTLEKDFGLEYQEDQKIEKAKEKEKQEQKDLNKKIELEKKQKLEAEKISSEIAENQKELAQKHFESLSKTELQKLEIEAFESMDRDMKKLVGLRKTGWKISLKLKMISILRMRLFPN